MAKRQKTTKGKGQLPLMEIGPKNSRDIKRAGRAYLKAKTERLAWLDKEQGQLEKIRELAKAEKLQPLSDGTIEFEVDGITIKLTPVEDKVTVKETGESTGGEE